MRLRTEDRVSTPRPVQCSEGRSTSLSTAPRKREHTFASQLEIVWQILFPALRCAALSDWDARLVLRTANNVPLGIPDVMSLPGLKWVTYFCRPVLALYPTAKESTTPPVGVDIILHGSKNQPGRGGEWLAQSTASAASAASPSLLVGARGSETSVREKMEYNRRLRGSRRFSRRRMLS